jgi:hypothetical protein
MMAMSIGIVCHISLVKGFACIVSFYSDYCLARWILVSSPVIQENVSVGEVEDFAQHHLAR